MITNIWMYMVICVCIEDDSGAVAFMMWNLQPNLPNKMPCQKVYSKSLRRSSDFRLFLLETLFQLGVLLFDVMKLHSKG